MKAKHTNREVDACLCHALREMATGNHGGRSVNTRGGHGGHIAPGQIRGGQTGVTGGVPPVSPKSNNTWQHCISTSHVCSRGGGRGHVVNDPSMAECDDTVAEGLHGWFVDNDEDDCSREEGAQEAEDGHGRVIPSR